MKIPTLSGKTLHERIFDPRLFRLQAQREFNLQAKQEFAGQAPGIFVGRYGYPTVRIGLLATEQYREHDDPLAWVRKKTTLQDIVSLRTQLVNAGDAAHVKLPTTREAERLKELAQEAAMAIKPVDLDVTLDSKPLFRLTREEDSMPHGPAAALRAARLTSNPKIPALIDKTVGDTDLLASEGLTKLWNRGYGEHQLSKLLSAGTLGQKLERRLVPTRWSITAVDDTVGKRLHTSIMDYPDHELQVHFGGYMGNHYLFIFLPQHWSFELFENAVGKKGTGGLSTEYTDFEGVRGRSSYAEKTAGGYYASRLAVLEHLQAEKRKAGVIAMRFITDEYWAPLGVWVVREASRAALAAPPLTFGSWELVERYVQAFVQRTYGVDPLPLLRASKLLAERASQRSLADFS